MKSYRVLIVHLTLVALLLGNVAGWLHVGCSDQLAGCCAPPPTLASNAPTVDDDCHSCCHHRHGNACFSDVPAKSSESGSGTDERDSGEQVPGDHDSGHHDSGHHDSGHHDSDSCSVCQSFFASRDATIVGETTMVLERLAVSRDAVPIDDVFATSCLSLSDTARGPPRV